VRSIRLSLLVYFLLLLAGALGAVSWLVYETTSKTLVEKEQSTRGFLETQYKIDCAEAESALDRRLLSQAQTLASMARTISSHYEGLYPLGLLGNAPLPQGYLLVPLWLAEGTHPVLAGQLFRMRQLDFEIDAAEDVIPPVHENQPQEYFQVFRLRGPSVLRSEVLEEYDYSLPMTEEVRKKAELYKGYFDDVVLEPGLKLRRVTLKAHVPRFRSTSLTFTWRLLPTEPKKGFFPRGKFPSPPPPPPRFTGFESKVPVIFIQYASDAHLLDEQIQGFNKKKNEHIAALASETHQALVGLRLRLWWICLATFVGILIGGFFLVRLGLAPLARLSEAVSQVSARDFRLKVDETTLPKELKPIVSGLSQTLDQLKKAFAREKQAAADISHELRTPLAALLTTLEVALRKKQRPPEEYRDLLQDCQGSGQQMMHLVERLMALARLDAGADRLRPRPVDVADLAHQCADLVRPLAEARGLSLDVQASNPLPLEIDPDKLREVLTNLLHNAIEYNRPQGSVSLTVQRENGHVLMEVRDTGIGIAPKDREHIFERFFRADPSRHAETPHAGLGLSIVKSYVDLLGGHIEVDSNDQGSTFRVQVPAGSKK
jgi:heavy metal sensor kinase